ncbi:MBL fold metallo-hydrolase [Planosporangium mesophilum]|uniref:MBL fold metallo-hydrolase n=1 Tax=Planosporangium mesophilum TaxID=689768 RepID=A0A8J3T9P2_9ACTN|nr:MBL fold metallo-hydrolase [Planosporangium mesophilum]NJC81479.1 MBL fold metallo-hydrolase [Planosporangium mesophilum]GII20864.1 MBL fold metallo-hydrolase [Planosporangium mesophilum]
MQLIKFTHACVRLEDGDRRLLIDPGFWTEREAFDGVTDILVTHEHADHIDVEHIESLLKSQDLRIFAPESVRAIAEKNAPAVAAAISPVAAGDTFTAGGFEVTTVGGEHAEIYEGLPGCANVGYLAEGVYHPGDSFFVPAQPVTTLLVPTSGPWFKLSEALDFVRAVAPAKAFPIHDRLLSTDVGFELTDRWMRMKGQTEYARIPIGEATTI